MFVRRRRPLHPRIDLRGRLEKSELTRRELCSGQRRRTRHWPRVDSQPVMHALAVDARYAPSLGRPKAHPRPSQGKASYAISTHRREGDRDSRRDARAYPPRSIFWIAVAVYGLPPPVRWPCAASVLEICRSDCRSPWSSCASATPCGTFMALGEAPAATAACRDLALARGSQFGDQICFLPSPIFWRRSTPRRMTMLSAQAISAQMLTGPPPLQAPT